ncbi:MAG: squalene--hopene cyclase [Rhodovibrionaceae bacterium]|nr:squalene--hopene cyclase [Rhodovibrionaceae bacterium]
MSAHGLSSPVTAEHHALRPPAPGGLWTRLEQAVDEAYADLRHRQRPDGHWIFEFEADATIPSEYILLRHFLGEVDGEVDAKVARYLRSIQNADGGWPLFPEGEANISATVKAYYALKLAGDDPEADHMRRARELVLARGGAAQVNVFTMITLALFGQVPWRAVPSMPAEIMLLPEWSPFHLSKVSYWSRTVIVPLLILMALKPQARNPRAVSIRELFVRPPEKEKDFIRNSTGTALGQCFVALDGVLKSVEPRFPKARRQKAIDAAVDFIRERLNGEDGLGGIFPAMANAVMALDALGYPPDHEDRATARASVEKLLLDRGDTLYCQPCLSPTWDTALAMHALMEADAEETREDILKACDWLAEREITEVKGDWTVRRPDLPPSGWAFQYWNDYYPDLDDTAVIIMALHRADPERYRGAIERSINWVLGMQSSNGGWGAFDVDNTHYYLNAIPFADHGALLDPPTSDVTARCIGALIQVGYRADHPAVKAGLAFLEREQEEDGSWYGRWGVNYIYGTWSVLCALNAAGLDPGTPMIRRAVDYLKARQMPDGGWGEDCGTYWLERRGEAKASTPSQTAWALLGLMAAGEVDSDVVRRGVDYLLEAPRDGAQWEESLWTGVGFPRVFYLKYHGYSAYFPLWALARYRNLSKANSERVVHGM